MQETYKHIKAEIQNHKEWIPVIDPEILRTNIEMLLRQAEYTILNHVEHHFPVKGYTCLWLLAESHLAIHTFPDDHTTYLELSGCNKAKNDAFIHLLNTWLAQLN